MTDLRHHGDGEAPAHAELLLCAAYLVGGLDAGEEEAFERHLAGCTVCMDECDRVGATALGFAALPAADVEQLLTEPWPPADGSPQQPSAPPALASPAPGTSPASVGGTDHSASPVTAGETARQASPVTGSDADRPAPLATASDRPAPLVTGGDADRPAPLVTAGKADRPGSRPPARPDAAARPPARRRRRLATAALALVAVVVAGVGVTVWTSRTPSPRPVQVQPVDAVTAEGTGASARLSVSVSARGDASAVQAKVSGLEPGARYRLYAVDATAVNHLVAQWTAGPDPREVTATVKVPLADLAFFSVTRVTGKGPGSDTAVVSATVVRPAPTR